MNNLVEIKNNQVVVNSRDVAEHFGKRRDHVIRDIESLIKKDVPKIGAMFHKTEIPDSYGRMQKTYYMNRDGFSLLVMGFTGKDAIEWKLKYIQAFNEMEEKLKNPMGLPDFSNPAEMARAWADEFERRKKAEQAIEEQKPKVLFADSVSVADDAILIGALAKLIKQNGVDIGQNRLFQKLRDMGYLIKSGQDKNMPTQKAMNMKLFRVKERTVGNPDGSVRTTRTTLVTGKGQIYFINLFLEGRNLK